MIAASKSLFDSAILYQPATRRALSATTLKAAPQAEANAPAAMPASLWRHTQAEAVVETRHSLVARAMFSLLATLGLGSVAYAAWQTWVLMSGNHFHDAISTFFR